MLEWQILFKFFFRRNTRGRLLTPAGAPGIPAGIFWKIFSSKIRKKIVKILKVSKKISKNLWFSAKNLLFSYAHGYSAGYPAAASMRPWIEAQKGDNSFSNLSDLSGQITQGQEDLFDKNGAQRPIPIYEPPTDKQPSDGLGVVASRNRLIPLTSWYTSLIW